MLLPALCMGGHFDVLYNSIMGVGLANAAMATYLTKNLGNKTQSATLSGKKIDIYQVKLHAPIYPQFSSLGKSKDIFHNK